MLRTLLAILLLLSNLFADYNNITLNELLTKTALLNNINIVMPAEDTNTKRYNISINNFVRARDLLEIAKILLKQEGYTLKQVGKFYIVEKIKDNRFNYIYKVKHSNSNNILNKLKNINLNTKLIKLDNNLILIKYKTKKELYYTLSLLSKLDYTPVTYLVSINIYDTDTSELNKIGINITNLNLDKEQGTILLNKTINTNLLPALITLLKDKQKSRLLASPRLILTPDKNSTASFTEGLTMPLQVKQQQIIQGTNPIVTNITKIIYKQIGLSLKLKYLSRTQDNKIKFFLDLKDTNLISYTDTGITTTNRSIQTLVNAKLNNTIVIAGVGREEVKKRIIGVPILKDIPILKYLFSKKEIQKTNRTLIVTIKIEEQK